MPRFEARTTIAAPIEKVFRFRLDLTTLPRYNPDVSDVRLVAGEALQPGATYTFRLRIAPGWTTTATLRVTDVEAPVRVGFAIESIMNARETCTFAVTTVAGALATELTFATEVPSVRGPLAPLVDRLFVVPNLKKQTLRELEWMKGCLETK
ncbi:MAG: SRPBCC family protein [Deltaproteobacteria bacterium]|nr:SRPBCC family protein [Deltaproteobacteria bacterium]